MIYLFTVCWFMGTWIWIAKADTTHDDEELVTQDVRDLAYGVELPARTHDENMLELAHDIETSVKLNKPFLKIRRKDRILLFKGVPPHLNKTGNYRHNNTRHYNRGKGRV